MKQKFLDRVTGDSTPNDAYSDPLYINMGLPHKNSKLQDPPVTEYADQSSRKRVVVKSRLQVNTGQTRILKEMEGEDTTPLINRTRNVFRQLDLLLHENSSSNRVLLSSIGGNN